MNGRIKILRAGPLVTIQDAGRAGYLSTGISASGPMDRGAFWQAGQLLEGNAGAALECTMAGLSFKYKGEGVRFACSGGNFKLTINKVKHPWGSVHHLKPKDVVDVTPGKAGNYGYIRFDSQIDVPDLLGSKATNMIVGLGGYEGRALVAGDKLNLISSLQQVDDGMPKTSHADGPIRFIWGMHAEHFGAVTRTNFVENAFTISTKLNRMGVRLDDSSKTFADSKILSLVSDAIVPGDIQILGDGTPIILMRDHQPTGGYPRIGTVISADLDRVAQLRPGTNVHFEPTTVAKAQALSKVGSQ